MIILANTIDYGSNALQYALDKENAKRVKVNHMPEGIEPTAIWYIMKHHCQLHQQDRTVGRKLERFMNTFVVSPSKEESANFTMDDWANLMDEALETMDSVGLIPKGMKKKVKTNFANSMSVGGLHSDSDSGTLHLHIDSCRVDLDGNTNDVHDIYKRAMMAAEIINRRHGWQQPQEIRDMRQKEIANDSEDILKRMHEFDIKRFFNMLEIYGYKVKPRYDKKGKLVGYIVGHGASVFKASDIGRRFMVSQLETTWRKLHPVSTRIVIDKPKTTVAPFSPSVHTARLAQAFSQPKVKPSVQTPRTPLQASYDITASGKNWHVEIPMAVKELFDKEAQISKDNDTATIENVIHTAVLLFAGYVDAATSMSESCGGGGSAPSSGWGKDKDEDYLKFARRCLQQSHAMCKPKIKYGRGR